MPESLNPVFKADIELAEELVEQRRQAEKAKPVPYGQQKLSAKQMRGKLPMDKELRKRMMNMPGGRDSLLNMKLEK